MAKKPQDLGAQNIDNYELPSISEGVPVNHVQTIDNYELPSVNPVKVEAVAEPVIETMNDSEIVDIATYKTGHSHHSVGRELDLAIASYLLGSLTGKALLYRLECLEQDAEAEVMRAINLVRAAITKG